ncbi:MAG TPA: nucleotide sugar dehydrogenase [Desulfobacterales bacterium]|nr:nucleotide sugar dehydrogenase [Desulfobacterales bacterium]HIP37907.1 nucleotide sugar dehydrogenase [Desulfocapsa sulfexigens]
MSNKTTVGIIGLGYVGLPLAITFGKIYDTIGYDLNKEAIQSYCEGIDHNKEVDSAGFNAAKLLSFTDDPTKLSEADFLIIAVPTPIDQANQPNLRPLLGAASTAGKHMKKGATVIFESTVYPGATEEACVPILEETSGLQWKKDFHVGYSPERINPGDKEHTLTKITKIVSADTPESLKAVSELYGSIIEAGIYPVPTIKEAEAAKVIENTQRDLNIALINELAIIFDRLNIDTLNVLEAAGSKWNFLPFRPGLVGGHCIGVDPYYLTHKAESSGYNPQVILAGRRINDNMGKFIAEKTVKMMLKAHVELTNSKVGIFGLTFKEDCPDLRNSRVIDIIEELHDYGIETVVHDPEVKPEDALKHVGIQLTSVEEFKNLAALIIAVPHKKFRNQDIAHFTGTLAKNGCLIDVKSMLGVDSIKDGNINFWRL